MYRHGNRYVVGLEVGDITTMGNYQRGSSKEYELANRLWEEDWAVWRQASSGGVGHESADVIGMRNGEVLIFESKYIDPNKAPIDVKEDSRQLGVLRDRAFGVFNPDGGGGVSGCYFAIRWKGQNVWEWEDWRADKIDDGEAYEPLRKLIH